jgi:tetratricopeptide (TPR) repeat protein
MARAGTDKGWTDVTGSDMAHRGTASRAALVGAALVLAASAFSTEVSARGRVSQGDVTQCADSPKAEAAVAACTRLYEDGGLDNRNKAIALGNRGAAYRLMGRYDEAIADFDVAIKLDAQNPQYWCQRGDLRAKKQNYAGAIEDYSAALDKVPNYVWAFRGRGQAYLGQGNAKLALADLNEALRAKPDDFNLTLLRGRANSQAQNYDAAVVDFTQALNSKTTGSLLPSERAIILSQRGFARLKQDRTPDAKADVDEALRIAPKSAFSLAVSGLIEEQLGHKADAASLYQRAVTLDSNIEFAQRGLERTKQTEAAATPPPLPPPAATPATPAPAPPTPAAEPSPPPTAKAEAKPKEPVQESGKGPAEELCARYVPTVGQTVLVACSK